MAFLTGRVPFVRYKVKGRAPKTFDTDHHRFHVRTVRMLPALDGAIAAMS